MSMKKRTKTPAAAKKAPRGATTKVVAKKNEVVKTAVRETAVAEAAVAKAPLDYVELPAECTTADAGALKDRLMKLIAHPGAVTLDRGAVQRVDTATLQMLAAFVRDRRAEGLAVEWSGEGAAFKNAASTLGLSSLL
jgi:anti-anti-sigma regulatory factor